MTMWQNESLVQQAIKTKLWKQCGDVFSAFRHYTNERDSSYDSVLTKALKQIAPCWFEGSVEQKKKALLKMAKNGEAKPHKKTKLGIALGSFIYSGYNYDAAFKLKLQRIAPDWFMNSRVTGSKNREILLKLAKKGAKRPTGKLGKLLTNYAYRDSKVVKYKKWVKEIKTLRGDWFGD